MKFSAFHGIAHDQAALDFIDIDNDEDLPLFFDPYVFANEEDEFSRKCADSIRSFFETVISCIRNQQHDRAKQILARLNEPNELCLGWSKGSPRGRGVGASQAEQLYDRLSASEAVRSGMISDLADCELFVEGIGPDKISDITANIIRDSLIRYTQDQCELHGVPVQASPIGPTWSIDDLRWNTAYADLPHLSGKPVVLVPKRLVRWIGDLSHQHQRYYQHFVLNFLKDHHLNANDGLVHVLKKGGRRVYKTELKDKYPLSKDFLFRFSRDNPEVLDRYKKAFERSSGVSIRDLDENFSTDLFVESLIEQLRAIPKGTTNASKYHNLMVGVLEFIFYPNLSNPKKETPLHEGRKRIDITYVNCAKDGFFFRIHAHHKISSLYVMVECKNYTSDPQNPELDQLAGRFSPNRGRFGFLLARSFKDKELFIRRCRDTAQDDRGFIVPLVDDDIIELLTMIKRGKRSGVDRYLEGILLKLVQ